jgi:hypothetical protein
MNRISNRLWWSVVAILCALILSSSGFSRQQTQEKQVTAPVAEVLRARRLEIVDKKGKARIHIAVTDDDNVFISVGRPGKSTPVLEFRDEKEIDFGRTGRKETEPASTAQGKEVRWYTNLRFWTDLGKSSSFLDISNATKSGEWSVLNATKADAGSDKTPAIDTEMFPGRIKYQVGDKVTWLQAK